jgi:choline dehydrogenase-like flavoprotein
MDQPSYDAIVVGSGASGSFAAKELTERGLEVLVLEAGRSISVGDFGVADADLRSSGIRLGMRIRAQLAGQHVQSRALLYRQHSRHLFVNDREHPFSTPADKPFLWIRGRQLGGRLHTYGRVLLRWSDYDFKAASRDGHGEDWPICYEELAPFYSQAEQFLQLRGCADGLANLPDGEFVGPAKLTTAERLFKKKTEMRWPDRHPIAWRYMPPNVKRLPQALVAAMETGRMTLRTDAIVRRVLTDPTTGLATGVEFVDRLSKQIETVSARAIMLCASPIETVRLMLNSDAPKHPNGLGNRSGMLGRYFMDQVPSLIAGSVPEVMGSEFDDTVPPDPFYGTSGGVYLPRFANLDRITNSEFARGFSFQGTIGRLPVVKNTPARFALMGFGEMLPYADNRVSLSQSKRDAWGMPIPHISCSMHANELALLREQMSAIKEMVGNAGFLIDYSGSQLGLEEFGQGAFPEEDWFSRLMFRRNFKTSMSMGAAIHECGGARMGKDPAQSVLNPHNQCWDAPNVYVSDASCFPSGGCAGTTLTIMALAIRSSQHLANSVGMKGTS